MMTNWKHPGFTLTGETPLPELGGVLYRMTHDKTGLELVWLKRAEENKTFGIAFETLPWNDTGVFHILEHSVLCGSDKYPVKEPFVELMKSSLNTFLNAMTFPDKTFYPISSRNDKDFVNLMRVYLDAVFCPLIASKPEIFYQEGWHYELDGEGNASYKGVVFNEMKGAFASADTLANGGLEKLLFPDTPYGFVSGGDPEAIPDLTYESFVDSYRRFYAPSNAYVFLDGDVDIENVLYIIESEYLCQFEKTQRMAPPAMQQPVTGENEGWYELAEGEEPEGKVRLSLGKVIGTYDQRERLVGMQVLAEVLCGSNQSPLCRAVLGEGLAEEVTMQVNDGILQPWVMLDVKNLREENMGKVQQVLEKQLHGLADGDLDHAQLEAVMANLEFRMREGDYGRFPKGLILGMAALESWLYGGDPAANLQVGDLFINLKKKMADGYFEQLIRDVLLDNPHNARLVLRPSCTLGEERRAREQARLVRETSAWTEEDRAAMQARQDRLTAWQESQDTPEQLATIPQLALEDIPDKPEYIQTEETLLAGIPVLKIPQSTGGIAYVTLTFDADMCTARDISCLSFAGSMLGETATVKHGAEEIINQMRLLCGEMDVRPMAFVQHGDPSQVTTRLCVSFSALQPNAKAAFALVNEILTGSRFAEADTQDMLRQTRMDIYQRAVMAGNSMGVGRMLAQFSAAGVVTDSAGGVAYYQWLKDADEHWDFAALEQQMKAVLGKVISRNGAMLWVSGLEDDQVAELAQMAATLPDVPAQPKAIITPWGKRKEGIAIPADIAFAVAGGNLLAHGGAYSGHMQLASQMISLGYLWNVIRVQGGAYGTGMFAQNNGLAGCYSYRDPAGAASLEKYRSCAAVLREMAEGMEDYTGFIIGAVAADSLLLTPKSRAKAAGQRYLCQTSWDKLCQRRAQLLSTTKQNLLACADVLESTLKDAGICLVGGREQLEACRELESIITL